MEFRWQGFNRRLHFSFEKVEEVTGVNSAIDEMTHFLMWDFDGVPLEEVIASLAEVQGTFRLPSIRVVGTGKPDSYHAYCFQGCSFRYARTILASTDKIDLKYLALGMMRGYFTLRFTDVKGREFEKVCDLPSKVPASCSYSDVNSFVKYTKRQK